MTPATLRGFEHELSKLAAPLAELVGRAGKAARNFGARQVHALTGAGARDAAQAAAMGLDARDYAAGITSLPGIARAMTAPGMRGPALRRMGYVAVGGGGVPHAVAAAAPLALAVPSLARGDERAAGGQSMRQKLVGLGLNTAAGAALGGLPIASGLAASLAADVGINQAVKHV